MWSSLRRARDGNIGPLHLVFCHSFYLERPVKPTLRINARDAVTAGLAASAWLAQGGSTESWPVAGGLMPCTGFAPHTVGTRTQCSYAAATAGNQMFLETRHEIEPPVYRKLAM